MKKVYDIAIKDLENLLKMLKENMYDSVVISDVMRLEDYINRIKNGFRCTEEIKLMEQLLEDLDAFHFYKPYYPFVEEFINSGIDVYVLDSEVKYKSFAMTDEQVVRDIDEFYGFQGNTFYSQFLEFKNEAPDHLKFIKSSLDTEGETLFLKSIGEAFIFSPNYSNITKFTILVHEIQHVIDFYINPSFSEYYIIRETIAMFMEMIAADFIVKKYSLKSEEFKRQQYLHAIVKYQSHNIMYKMEVLDIAENNKDLTEDELLSLLNKEGFELDDMKFYFDQGIISDFVYQIAYLIAVELYILYQNNKDLALTICEDIIINGNSSNIFDLLTKYNITLNSKILEYENKIYKKK